MTIPRRCSHALARALVWVPSALSTVVALCALWSCGGSPSAADEVQGPGLDWGGQTGSLVPPSSEPACGPLTGKDRVLTLAGESRAFVARGDATPELFGDAGPRSGDAEAQVDDAGAPFDNAAPAGDWYIVTESGELVDVPEPSGAAPATIALDEELDPGRHQLNYSCAGVARSVVLVIEEPQPAPVLVRNAALWYSPSHYTCSSIDYVVSLTLTLDAAASSLGDTAQISVVGEDFVRVVAPFATIEPGTTQFEFGIPICQGEHTSMCIPRGEVALSVLTEWVDSDVPSQYLTLDVDANCGLEEAEASTEEGEPACTVVSKASKGRFVAWSLTTLVGLVCAGRLASRRRSRAPR